MLIFAVVLYVILSEERTAGNEERAAGNKLRAAGSGQRAAGARERGSETLELFSPDAPTGRSVGYAYIDVPPTLQSISCDVHA